MLRTILRLERHLHINVGNCSFAIEHACQLIPKRHVVSAPLKSLHLAEKDQEVTCSASCGCLRVVLEVLICQFLRLNGQN